MADDLQARTLSAWDRLRVRWALLREPAGNGQTTGDTDLLLHPDDVGRARASALAEGLVQLPGVHRGTHLIGYDESAGRWVWLHCVTELSYGPWKTLRTDTADAVLERRLPGGRLQPTDEFWETLLHCLLDGETSRRATGSAWRASPRARTSRVRWPMRWSVGCRRRGPSPPWLLRPEIRSGRAWRISAVDGVRPAADGGLRSPVGPWRRSADSPRTSISLARARRPGRSPRPRRCRQVHPRERPRGHGAAAHGPGLHGADGRMASTSGQAAAAGRRAGRPDAGDLGTLPARPHARRVRKAGDLRPLHLRRRSADALRARPSRAPRPLDRRPRLSGARRHHPARCPRRGDVPAKGRIRRRDPGALAPAIPRRAPTGTRSRGGGYHATCRRGPARRHRADLAKVCADAGASRERAEPASSCCCRSAVHRTPPCSARALPRDCARLPAMVRSIS